jgi:hypothetical protein
MTHLGDVVFRHVCTHKAHIRARRGYEPTREAAMAEFAKSWRYRAGIDLKIQNASLHFDRMSRALQPPETTA